MKNKDNSLVLDKEETRIEKDLSSGKYRSVKKLDESEKLLKQAAQNFQALQKSKKITLRVNQQDLLMVKAKAKKNKIPYQTLLSVLIHQFAQGKGRIEI